MTSAAAESRWAKDMARSNNNTAAARPGTADIHMLGFIPNDGNWTDTDMTSSTGAVKY
jgi:hypothetical protein